MNVHPDRPKFMGRVGQRIAFIFDPDGNSIELIEIPPEVSNLSRTKSLNRRRLNSLNCSRGFNLPRPAI